MATQISSQSDFKLGTGTLPDDTANAADQNPGSVKLSDYSNLTPGEIGRLKDNTPSNELNLKKTIIGSLPQYSSASDNPKTGITTDTATPTNNKSNDLVTNKNSTEQAEEKKNEPIMFQTKVGEKIPDVLNNIMMMSKEVHNDSINVDNSDPKNPKTYVPRIQSNIIEDPKTKQKTVVYYIEKFAKPMVPGTDGTSTGETALGGNAPSTTTSPSSGGNSTLPDVLEYDYIYTGKNVDILQFDMSTKLSFNSLNPISVVHPNATNTNQNLTPENQAATQKKPNENAGEASDETVSRIRGNGLSETDKNGSIGAPVVDPGRIGSGSLSPETLFAARKNISDQLSVALTSNVSNLKIVGNPLLLAGYTLPSDTLGSNDQEPTSQSIQKAKDDHEAQTGANSGQMLKVKVNVRTPKPSYMQGAKLGSDDNFYSSPFWLTSNQFMVHKITSKFTRGEFVQILELKTLADQSNTDYSKNPAKSPPKGISGKTAQDAINEAAGDNIKAFLAMISHAEGTYGHGDNGYNVRFGTVLFDGYATHPWHVKPWSAHTKGAKVNTPAGRYQILVGTYDGLVSKCGGDFSPSSQDRMAIAIMKSVGGSYNDVYNGNPKAAISKLKGSTWTGLQKDISVLLKWYEQHGGTYKPQQSATAAGTGTGQTANRGSNPAGVNSLNDKLASGTQNAINKGVRYKMGSRDPNSGQVDCSGWVLANTGEAVKGMNDPAAQEGYALMKQGNTAAGIIQTVGKASGQELKGSDVNVNNLKPGMVIGIDYSKTPNRRYEDIDHIVQVVQDPNSGKLQISESSSGAKGVRIQDADKWLANKQNVPKYAVDPFYKMR